MNVEQLKIFTVQNLKMHKRIIKPWKKPSQYGKYDHYAQGWNDCLKEIEKNHKEFMAHIEKNIKEFTLKERFSELGI